MSAKHIGRIRRGSSLAELSGALLIMALILTVVFDCSKLVMGAQINDNACREAARIAATGDPGSAKQRAESIIYRARQESSGMLSNLRLVSVVSQINGSSDPTTIQLSGSNVTGLVVVTTAADVQPFFTNWLSASQRVLTLKSQQSFPYTYIAPISVPAFH
jgi:Flp pilus assembly protein TadG